MTDSFVTVCRYSKYVSLPPLFVVHFDQRFIPNHLTKEALLVMKPRICNTKEEAFAVKKQFQFYDSEILEYNFENGEWKIKQIVNDYPLDPEVFVEKLTQSLSQLTSANLVWHTPYDGQLYKYNKLLYAEDTPQVVAELIGNGIENPNMIHLNLYTGVQTPVLYYTFS